MKLKLVIRLAWAAALVAALTAATVQVSSATPPKLTAKRAQAQAILNEIAAIDEQLNTISEQYDGARVRLDALRSDLRSELASLRLAQARNHLAQQRAAKLAVWLYTSSHASSLDVILGAHNFSEFLALSDAEDAISKQTTAVATEAIVAKKIVQARVAALEIDRAAAQATVRELAQRRAAIQQGLAERTRLLAKVQTEVTRLEAQERARQARLAALARARLAAEQAAREKAAAEAAAAAKARAEAAARAKAAAVRAQAAAVPATTEQTTTTFSNAVTPATTTETTTTTTTTTSDTATATDPATTDPATTTDVTTTTDSTFAGTDPLSASTLPAGHPEAATIALQYLGVPYVWSGASPSGFDCSGLVTYVYAQLGIALPHFAAAQWTYGVAVPYDQLQPGDLVFFDSLNHVGIYLGYGQFVAAPHTGAFVRIASMNDPWYSSHYVGARRI